MRTTELIMHLKKKGSERNRTGMASFGINVENAYGVPVPHLRELAKKIGLHQDLSLELWETKVHEARLLAAFMGDYKKVSERQMDRWVRDFDSWDICDAVCGNLFDKTDFAHRKAVEWSSRKEEYVKRAGFAMMATLAVHDKRAGKEAFEKFFPCIIREAGDERNYVKKAVNWALRQIGKRSLSLNRRAIEVSKEIMKQGTPSAHWIASNALHELQSEKVQKRLME